MGLREIRGNCGLAYFQASQLDGDVSQKLADNQ